MADRDKPRETPRTSQMITCPVGPFINRTRSMLAPLAWVGAKKQGRKHLDNLNERIDIPLSKTLRLRENSAILRAPIVIDDCNPMSGAKLLGNALPVQLTLVSSPEADCYRSDFLIIRQVSWLLVELRNRA